MGAIYEPDRPLTPPAATRVRKHFARSDDGDSANETWAGQVKLRKKTVQKQKANEQQTTATVSCFPQRRNFSEWTNKQMQLICAFHTERENRTAANFHVCVCADRTGLTAQQCTRETKCILHLSTLQRHNTVGAVCFV